ncbi:MAG: DUF503 domain-containing protein [Candidatus Marinimicrobia bacterium]|nr:DUF503 domain-containing protein [Candidatus Neomarinimicrobiota bacterium]
MELGLLQLELHLPVAQSLKQKRRVVKSLKDRLQTRFNVSVAEVGYLDKWQRSSLAIAMVSTDRRYLEASFEKISAFVDQELLGSAFITARQLEFF